MSPLAVTDTSEKGLETLIMRHMTGTDGFAVAPNSVAKPPTPYGGIGYLAGSAQDYDRAHAIDVLRKGVSHGPLHFDLFYGTPSPGNAKAETLYARNRFSITRQFAYSMDETRRALELGLFINGLPIATFELKNSLMTWIRRRDRPLFSGLVDQVPWHSTSQGEEACFLTRSAP